MKINSVFTAARLLAQTTKDLPVSRDIPDIWTAMKKIGDAEIGGYVMAIFITAARICGYKPVKSAVANRSFLLAVQGRRDPRNVFWSASKADDLVASP